jgi:hypothetical protein
MGSSLAVLDESKSDKHPIISVGGFVCQLSDIPEIEERWRESKHLLGLGGRSSIKYSMSWAAPELRSDLINRLGDLPAKAVVALLEDFRPRSFKLRRETRAERYIHLPAFEYVLQRLVEGQYCAPGGGPHFVIFDHRDDFPKLSALYTRLHATEWKFAGRVLPSLSSRGWAASLTASCEGPLNEIADLIVSAMTRWAGGRCAEIKGKAFPERAELDANMRSLVGLFPSAPRAIPKRRQGYSVITHTANRTGQELLYANVDRWLNELEPPQPLPAATPYDPEDDIPF